MLLDVTKHYQSSPSHAQPFSTTRYEPLIQQVLSESAGVDQDHARKSVHPKENPAGGSVRSMATVDRGGR